MHVLFHPCLKRRLAMRSRGRGKKQTNEKQDEAEVFHGVLNGFVADVRMSASACLGKITL